MKDRNVEAVRERLARRAEVGIRKYGVTTERGDLTDADWLRHLQEELLDAAVYIEAALSHDEPRYELTEAGKAVMEGER